MHRAWTWDGRLGGAQRQGDARTPFEASSRHLDEWGLDASLTHAPAENVTVSARAEWISLAPGESAGLQAVRFGPRFTWAMGSRARLEGETLWSPGATAQAWPTVSAATPRARWEHVLHRLYKRALGIQSWEAPSAQLRAEVASELLDRGGT